MLIQLADVHFAYPGTEIFESLSFQVNPGERIGLVGPNGAGKSTLLRMMAGELEPDLGQVVRARGKTLAYMHQSQEFHGAGTLWDTLLQPFRPLLQMRADLAALEHTLAETADPERAEALLKRYGHLQEEYTQREGYTLEVRARQLAMDLGFTESDLQRGVDTLSGGERGRVELAKAVLQQPDLLLLDEPTNHLDVEGVEHLEQRLMDWHPGRAFVLISHDRYFLRAVCKDIVDVEGLGLVRYSGGYEKYLVERRERHERLSAAYERQQGEIARTEDFIRRNIAGQKTKQAQSRRKMLEKMDRLEQHRDDWREAGRVGLRFDAGEHRGGKEALRAQDVELGYGDGPALVQGLSLTIYRGERVGIVGPNGAGKTTLMKALIGRLQPRQGVVVMGQNVRIGYFDQKLSDLDEERSLIEEVRTVRGDWNEDVVRQYLGRFRFTGDDGFRKVKGLSGGERNRLTLAKMMLEQRNLLAMDEPTNHLDIPAREVLEAALLDFDGTLLVVSHDRYFLDRVVTKILHLDPATGRIDEHVGNYTDWRQRAERERQAQKEAQQQAREAAAEKEARRAAQGAQAQGRGGAGGGTENEKQQRLVERQQKKDRDRERERKQRRMEQIEAEIHQRETELVAVRAQLAQDHGTEWQRLHAMVEEEQKLSRRVKSLEAEWERLGVELEGPA